MPQWDYYGGREQATAEANQAAWHTLGHSGLTRVKPGCPCYGQRMRHNTTLCVASPGDGLPGCQPGKPPNGTRWPLVQRWWGWEKGRMP